MIRHIQADDLPFLEEMLYEAAAAYNPEVQAMGKEALLRLAAPLLADWGRESDAGLVTATEAGQRLGAAWYRYPTEEARGGGFVAPDMPEPAIGLVPDARSRAWAPSCSRRCWRWPVSVASAR